MFDCHYDLLTHIYMKKNDISYIKDYCKKVYRKDNITGGIFNLFYMNPEEMKNELNIDLNEINIIKNLKFVKALIEKYDLIPSNTNYIFRN